MKAFGKLIIAAGTTAMLAGCWHRGSEGVSGGDIAIDSLSATKTAILRVDNTSPTTVRLYMVMPGMKPNYVAKALPGQVRSWVLDPQMVPAASVSFEARPEGGTALTVGPYKVNRNETIEVAIPSDVTMITATVHKSTP
jgi:hypothetical protein